jgi:hypothetical protein
MVYKLYARTYEEVLAVEPDFAMNEQECEAFTL